MKKRLLLLSIVIGFSLNGMSEQEAHRAYFLRILRKGAASTTSFTPVQQQYADAGKEKFLEDVRSGSLPVDQLVEVGKLFVYAPEMDTDCYMHRFDERADAIVALEQAVADQLQYHESLKTLTQQFEQDSMHLARVAMAIMEPELATKIFNTVPHIVNHEIYYYHGHDRVRGTLLDHIAHEKKEEFNENRRRVLDKVQEILLAHVGKHMRHLESND